MRALIGKRLYKVSVTGRGRLSEEGVVPFWDPKSLTRFAPK
jgi:hypothetical protein